MAVKTFTTGEVLTAADTNTYLNNGGLVYITQQTIGSAVSSVTVTGCFSSTYENYHVVVSGGVASTNNSMLLTLGATATGYYRFAIYGGFGATTVSGANTSNGTSWADAVYGTANSLFGEFDLIGPNVAKNTHLIARTASSTTTGLFLTQGGYLADTTQYSAFTLTCNSGTVTGGTIRVYGYRQA